MLILELSMRNIAHLTGMKRLNRALLRLHHADLRNLPKPNENRTVTPFSAAAMLMAEAVLAS